MSMKNMESLCATMHFGKKYLRLSMNMLKASSAVAPRLKVSSASSPKPGRSFISDDNDDTANYTTTSRETIKGALRPLLRRRRQQLERQQHRVMVAVFESRVNVERMCLNVR